ncbi:MAG: hypothetical protein ACJ8AS_09300 [Hyphomicrobiales bacterium]
MIRLALRTMPVFAVIIGFAMMLAAYMNFSGVRSAYLDLIRSRMAVMADGISRDIAAAQELGIRLSEQTTLPAVLERQAGADPLMLSIDVMSESGDVLFSSDKARIGHANNSVEDGMAFRYEKPVVNDFGAPVGTVLVRLDRARIDGEVLALRRDILTEALPAGLAAVVAGSLICLLLLMRIHRTASQSASAGDDDPIARAELEIGKLEPELQS